MDLGQWEPPARPTHYYGTMAVGYSYKPDIQDTLGAVVLGELTINAFSDEAAKLKTASKLMKVQAVLKKIAEIRAHAGAAGRAAAGARGAALQAALMLHSDP